MGFSGVQRPSLPHLRARLLAHLSRAIATRIARVREVLFLIGKENAILWADAGASAVAIPDSRARWEKIWTLRGELEEIAHTHPIGPLGFSHEDETTIAAVTSALGKSLRFSVVAPDGMIVRQDGRDARVENEPWWTRILRELSGMKIGENA